MNRDDIDNLRAIMIRKVDGTLDEWLETLSEEELQYALILLQQLNTSRDVFVNSI